MRRTFIIAALAASAVGLLSSAAGAAGTGDWHPAPSEPFVTSGVCSFTMKGDIVRDTTEARTLSTYPDGSVEVEEARGPLAIRFTNMSTGRSVVRDLSGHGIIHYFQDGGREYRLDGGGSVPVRVDSPGFPQGWYILHGSFTVVGHTDGTRIFSDVHATVENLCETLA
ncbi:hypothetical protein GCM10023191_039380 [Actinoallomurus oryzae]|uniref:Allene oxide cyclase barrel-like domain-containing protein n=1 Tax=Actinoallomurus oryzae TaxID=502180 RepID=A0ABP8Q378_9ACTN